MSFLDDQSIQLVLTSPPYPMIQMWDAVFSSLNREVSQFLDAGAGDRAFEAMHAVLDKVWQEAYRLLCPGGFLCINIGDATRRCGDHFKLYPNQSRITQACYETGFHPLPHIIWRKETNAPNKFMGSGLLPAGAYVTLEHEYILIFRRGGKREFSNDSAARRRESAIFWEERNSWFSDLWDFKGIRQRLERGEARKRSAAFPFELAFRLINMFTIQGDTVLDPFSGTATSSIAAAAAGRNSLGIDIDPTLSTWQEHDCQRIQRLSQQYQSERLRSHKSFLRERSSTGKDDPKHWNEFYACPVISRHESFIRLPYIQDLVQESPEILEFQHSPLSDSSDHWI